MSEAKPLSKETLKELEMGITAANFTTDMFAALLAAEQFWREAVKNARDMCYECNFCRMDGSFFDGMPDHKPDCPWLLAQDE